MAGWLNTAFSGFDGSILTAMNNLAVKAGAFFTPFFKIISLLGEKGILFLVAAVVLMLFSKTRKMGICIFGAIACGALFTNIILKDVIARPRPFESGFYDFWAFVGSTAEDGFSFPSGHVTATAAGATALLFTANKKWSWAGVILTLLMALSRVYLAVHYPTDVIAGMIVGAIAGTIAFFITKLIYFLLNKYSHKRFFEFVYHFDLAKNRKGKKEQPIQTEQTEKATE